MTHNSVMRLVLWLGVTAAANRSTTVAALERRRKLGYVMTNSNIYTARDAWLANPTAAEATYGHISTWETGRVTDMSCLFNPLTWCGGNTLAKFFNEDIGAWDISGVTRMYRMFYSASAFDQDLGWCVGDDVNLGNAFSYSGFPTPCASTSCGVGDTALLRAPYR